MAPSLFAKIAHSPASTRIFLFQGVADIRPRTRRYGRWSNLTKAKFGILQASWRDDLGGILLGLFLLEVAPAASSPLSPFSTHCTENRYGLVITINSRHWQAQIRAKDDRFQDPPHRLSLQRWFESLDGNLDAYQVSTPRPER